MIHPNMATMFAFIATDAAIRRRCLLALCGPWSAPHSIPSPSMATLPPTIRWRCSPTANPARARISDARGADYQSFAAALESVCKSLALAIVADGEGAQRVIEIEVRGAPSDRAADQVARTIANSPLVKTAFAGADPNWGRILAAAGRSGVKFDSERVDIWLAGISVCRRGREHPFDERRRAPENAREARASSRRSAFRRRPRAHVDLRFHQGIHPHQRQLPHITGCVKPRLFVG